ncbi:type VI secretion system ImpA family N-terminal domain-containing protein [Vibrio parahaemolyticus]|uniref:type VI secretion system ImpA family N-terminal domain-containing protein n=2 Tax=Vibrio parahaemolyticus TaxID=670 RepID=UPI00084B50FD|nr:type VI secretion system ImpA family N-terminal domain-containing protein [Vibrio parahaemolyticus]EGQ8047515.1 type VI secretion protein [Vibrio parahaemolyticus]EHH2867643.1 type VI secretion protein [Vibrio parahaemolyticus]ELA9315338.1 type VI secretion system ImpA family N-terminal domain-containing protein [Vibrio parahaemolyticus]MBM5035533.1 type VI secretion system ImpA family N-terminal domain-containing protein [Vibrio parahaemolyticus]MBM5048593.1 type VI secretion system ImpA f
MFFSDFTRRPIDESNPSGTNPNGLDDFDEIKRQINGLNKVTGRVSWKTVQTLSKEILRTKGKDFRCSCYFTVAAINNDGLKGLVEGLNSVLDLCVVYWYSAYPEYTKANARISAIEWMVEYTEKRMKKHRVLPEELPLIEAAHQLCLRIEEELRLHYGIKAPSFGRIRRPLNQWIEEIKEEKTKQEKTSQTKPASNPPSAGIRVEIAPPTNRPVQKKVEQPKVEEEAKSSRFIVYTMIGLLIIAFTSHFIYKQHQYTILKERIGSASLTELVTIVNSLSVENKNYQDDLRSVTVERLHTLMSGWTLDPVKVSQVNTIEQLTNDLTKLYPDSSSAQQLRDNFLGQRSYFEDEFEAIYKRFAYARTVFANIAKQSADKDAKKAYEYSNSLFPLLGRIEYAEKNSQRKEIERSLLLLNAYLYKINQLQAAEKDNK